jgi:deoxyribose-phosphate aldolase
MELTREALATHIDHTVLGPETTPADVERLCGEARKHGMNVCVPPCYLDIATEEDDDLTVATVIGFPHGQNAPAGKRAEAELAWEDGADELDVVTNVGRLKAGEDEAVRDELAELVAAVPIPVKVIIETALLTDEEKHRACAAARDADAAMVKTSTGFADGGATLADVELMSEYLPVKASGGVGSYEEAMAMLETGAERIGASSGVEILEGAPES